MVREISLNVFKPRNGVFTPLGLIPDIQIIFVGAAACTRHRANEMRQMVSAGRMSIMCLDEVDFVTGEYIDKIKDAVRGLCKERKPKSFIILPNCQSALLSTDYGIITKELSDELGVPVKVREGCHICGFEAESEDDFTGNTEQLIYGFLRPKGEKTEIEKSVNIISVNPLSEKCEIYDVLRQAGIKTINELKNIKTFDEYQNMAKAQLNIMCNDNGDNLGKSLEAQLNIPYVTLSGVYDAIELNRRYAKIGKILDVDIDTSEIASKLYERFNRLLPRLEDVSVTVSGVYAASRWLIENGVRVGNIRTNPHIPMSVELEMWIREHSPNTVICNSYGRWSNGKSGKPLSESREGKGKMHNGHDDRFGGKNSHGYESNFGSDAIDVGYSAVMDVIESLEDALEE